MEERKDYLKMKKLFAVLLVLAMIAAMGVASIAEEASGHQELLNIAGSDPEDVSPFKTDKGTKSMLWSVYESLYDLDPNTGELCPVLVDGTRGENNGYTIVDDTTYEIYLQEGIYDHAGNPVTASDVAFTYMTNIEKGFKSYYSKLEEAVALDDTTVQLKLSAPIENVSELLPYFINIWVYTEKAYNDSPSGLTTDACGTGRYKLTEFVGGASLTMEAWDNYWQKDESKINERHQAHADKIVEYFMSEETQIVIGLETGSIDICTKITTESCSDFLEGGSYEDQVDVSALADNKLLVLTPNCSPESPMSDPNLRLACYYAIDNTYVVAALGNGSAIISNALGISDGTVDYNPDWETIASYQNTYDLELAKEYLAKSNYNGETLTIMTNTDNNGVYRTVALVISSFLEQLGVKTDIVVYDKTTAETNRRDPQAYDMEIGTAISVASSNMEMYNFLFNTATTGTGMTQWFVEDEKLNELFATAYSIETNSPESMEALYDYVIENGYAYGLLRLYANVAYRTDKVTDIMYQGQHLVVPGSSILK